ncbi:MAG: cadherin-like beta sandwich domain-containing protein, partial [Bacilli bacterium]|nr:cadherin-like beta sandwich domain-containing protein [Bacilli bacterium]
VSNYTITVPYEVSKLNIKALAADDKAKVEVIGNDTLLVGQVSTIQIKVTAEDGSVRMYMVNATRSTKTSNTYLKSLGVKDFSLSPAFNKNTTNYTVAVNPNTKSLDLSAIAENGKAKVEILGNDNFKEGKNTVLIQVTDENGFNRVYQIDAIKPAKTILGLPVFWFWFWFFIILAIIALAILLITLLKRKKKATPAPVIEVNPPAPAPTPSPTPVIEFKPEFNFGSKNGTDDDVVYQGTLNQGNTIPMQEKDTRYIENAYYEEADYHEAQRQIDYDKFDETITKDELIKAIKEGMKTKNTDKLQMLLKQDELNQLKKAIKEKERRNTRSDRYDD